MKKPTRKERRRLQRLRGHTFNVDIDAGGVVRQLGGHATSIEPRR